MQENLKILKDIENRKLDSKGRIVIPSSIRKSMNLSKGDKIWVKEDKRMILLYIDEQ